MTALTLTGAQALRPEGLSEAPVTLAGGMLQDSPQGRAVDLPGWLILPGIVDIHGDGFERHMAPRRGALRAAEGGIVAAAAEMAANGITTGVMAQFYSWEGGMRGPEFAEHVFGTLASVAPVLDTDLRPQMRLETHMVDDFPQALALIDRFGIPYVVFNDHLQHDRLAIGKQPRRLTGQALKAGRNPDDHFAYMIALHRNAPRVPAALDALCAGLSERGVRMGSHDDRTASGRATWDARGVTLAEFPETREAAAAGAPVILGAPNVVRGGSHTGNVSARALIAEGLCAALASDYHYPALREAVWVLVDEGITDLAEGWRLVSGSPARLLGLEDRGRIAPGLRADLVLLEPGTRRIGATFARGRLTYATGETAARLIG